MLATAGGDSGPPQRRSTSVWHAPTAALPTPSGRPSDDSDPPQRGRHRAVARGLVAPGRARAHRDDRRPLRGRTPEAAPRMRPGVASSESDDLPCAGWTRLDFPRKQSVPGIHDGPDPCAPAARPALHPHRGLSRLPRPRRHVPRRRPRLPRGPRPFRPPPTGGRGVAAIAHDAREVMSRTSSSVARRTWPAAMPPPTTAPNRLGAVARSHRRTKCSSVR